MSGTQLEVFGSHTYQKSGTFPTRVTVRDELARDTATGSANVPTPPLAAQTNRYVIGPIDAASGKTPMLLHLNLNGTEQAPVPLTPGGDLVINGGTAGDVFTVNLGNLADPTAITGAPFRRTVNGLGGGDDFRVQSLPNVPGLNLTLDPNVTTAPVSGAPGGATLSFDPNVPALGNVIAYDDPAVPGALRLDLTPGTLPASLAFRDFGSIPEIRAQSVEIRGDFGASPASTATAAGRRLIGTAAQAAAPAVGLSGPYNDDITVTGTGRGRFDATINSAAVAPEALRFASPSVSVFGGQLSDVVTVTPYIGGPWGVGVGVDGGSQNLPSRSQPSPGDRLVIVSNGGSPGQLDVHEGGPRTANNLSYTNLEAIVVRTPTNRARDSLAVTDSKAGNRLDVQPGATGAVGDPLVKIHQALKTGADHLVGVSSTTVGDNLAVNLNNGAHVVNVLLRNPPSQPGRTITVTGDGTDHLHFTDPEGNAEVTNTRYPRNSGVVQVRYPSRPKGAKPVYTILYNDMIIDDAISGTTGAPDGDRVRTTTPVGVPGGPLSGGGMSSAVSSEGQSRPTSPRVSSV